MKRHAIRALFAGAFLILFGWAAQPQSAAATTWRVKPTGNDANACTSIPTACATIGGVIAKPGFVDGDTIQVMGGFYTTVQSFVLTKNNVTITGFNANIDCAGGDPNGVFAPTSGCELQGNNSTFKGFTVRRGWVKTGASVNGGCTPTPGGGQTSTGNIIRLNTFTAAPFTSTDVAYTGGTGVEVKDCNSGAEVSTNRFAASAGDPNSYVFLLINNNWGNTGFGDPSEPNPDPDLVPTFANINTFDAKNQTGRSSMVLCSEPDDGVGPTLLPQNGTITAPLSAVKMGTNFFPNGALVIGTFFGSFYCPPN
ncbi:MAG: hypothetical protein HY695_19720 [Deltaproteobacteria bacterium]|nr:hypothetical protein [Deltaproteobacteria bacterium]